MAEKGIVGSFGLGGVGGRMAEMHEKGYFRTLFDVQSFDASVTPVAAMLAEVSTLPGVLDMETRKAPIERVIAGLYRQWRAG